MLKLTIRRETSSLGKAGDMHEVLVDAGGLTRLLSLVEPDLPMAGEPPDAWWVYVLGGNCSAFGASLLHALELGLKEAARWLAVELLRDSTPPAAGEQAEGVALWLDSTPQRPARVMTLWLCGLGEPGHIGQVITDQPSPTVFEFQARWLMSDPDLNSKCVRCASKEQALAVLIEHAAPWIAAALAVEVEKAAP